MVDVSESGITYNVCLGWLVLRPSERPNACVLCAAPVVSGERLKKFIIHKLCNELPEGPFCIVYMHSTVQKEDNSPGITILRWIYEELPSDFKDRLQALYFIHPGLRSRLVFATLGRFFLSGGWVLHILYLQFYQVVRIIIELCNDLVRSNFMLQPSYNGF